MGRNTTAAAVFFLFVQLYVNFQPNTFRIHGLWPNDQNGSWPQYCPNAAKFNISKLESILPELEQYWEGFEPTTETLKKSEKFWKHEYERHGTCAAEVNASYASELAYFTEALLLRSQYPAYDMLEAIGVTPNGDQWPQHEILEKWVAQYGYWPVFSCDRDHLLIDVRLCINPRSMTPFNCSEIIYQSDSAERCGFYFVY